MLIGYARVSTHDQDTSTQVDALTRAGVVRIFDEQASGVKHRPSLEALLYSLRAGDTVVVYKIDRFARSLSDLLRILARLDALGASFRSLTEPIDTSTSLGRLMLQLLGSFAEFERSVIYERCSAGRALARSRGVRFGRPRRVPVADLPALVASGLSACDIARMYGLHRSSVSVWIQKLGLSPRGPGRSPKLERYRL